MPLRLQTLALILVTTVANSVQQELIGRKIVDRNFLDRSRGPVYTEKDVSFPRSGQVIGWKFYSKGNGIISLQVWRPDKPGECTSMRLIGATKLDVKGTGVQTIMLEANRRISVKQGDVVGWNMLQDGGIIPYSGSSGAQNLCYQSYGKPTVSPTRRYNLDYRISYNRRRFYSIAAIFTSSQGELQSIGFPTTNRPYRDDGSFFTFVDKRASFPSDGEITGWEFYAKEAGRVYLQIWRPATSGSCSNMQLIEDTNLKVNKAGLIEYTLKTPLQVKAGDLIGWSHPEEEIIAFSRESPSSTQNQCFGRFTSSTPGKKYNPTDKINYNSNRMYSVKAYFRTL